jgi:hypothetical protein
LFTTAVAAICPPITAVVGPVSEVMTRSGAIDGSCVSVKIWPPTKTVALRGCVVLFVASERLAFPEPVPVEGLIEIQGELVHAAGFGR